MKNKPHLTKRKIANKSMNKKLLLYYLFLTIQLVNVIAQEYPFNLPQNMTATMNITSSVQEPFNNLLLGVNLP